MNEVIVWSRQADFIHATLCLDAVYRSQIGLDNEEDDAMFIQQIFIHKIINSL